LYLNPWLLNSYCTGSPFSSLGRPFGVQNNPEAVYFDISSASPNRPKTTGSGMRRFSRSDSNYYFLINNNNPMVILGDGLDTIISIPVTPYATV
jgi:hypothetical protein